MKKLLIILSVLLLSSTATAGTVQGVDHTRTPRIIKVDDIGRTSGGVYVIDACDATTGWSAINTDTTGLATDLDHVMGTNSLEFDKVDGAANTTMGGIAKTITSINMTEIVENNGSFGYSLNVSALTDISYCFLRLGTSVSHYNEWRIPDTSLSTGWNALRFNAASPNTSGSTGNGWNPAAILYVSVGCVFDASGNALADLRVDHITANSGLMTSSDINANVSSSTSNTDVNLAEVAGTATNVNGGNKDAGTQTVAIADDDIVSDAATETAAAINASSQMDVNIAASTGLALNDGAKSATTLRVVVANDDIVSDAATETAAAINASSQMDSNIAAQSLTAVKVSATAAANTLGNPMFTQLSQDGTNAVATAYPLPVSATTAANATANRIYTNANVDQLGGVAINTNGGAIDTGTQTVTIATDDNVSTKLTGIDTDTNIIQGDTTSIDGKITVKDMDTTGATDNIQAVGIVVESATGAVVNGVTAPIYAAVSKDNAANATANRIYTAANVDQLGGVAIATNGGVIGTGVQTITIATDDPVNDAAVETAAAINASSQMDVNIAAQGATALAVSATGAANATGNRIYTHANVDQLGGVAVNTNGGNRDTGTITVAIADDDNASTKLTGIDSDTNIIQGDTTSIQTSIELRNAKFDDDAVSQCVAITAADVDYNIVTAGDWVCMTASGNTAFIRCGTTPAVDHTVGNFSLVIPEGATICQRLTGPQCAVIGVAAGGFLCFGHRNSAL